MKRLNEAPFTASRLFREIREMDIKGNAFYYFDGYTNPLAIIMKQVVIKRPYSTFRHIKGIFKQTIIL
ncbi:MAG: hypothetical protein WA130_07405 [Candidatus Methanoperedens sp.]